MVYAGVSSARQERRVSALSVAEGVAPLLDNLRNAFGAFRGCQSQKFYIGQRPSALHRRFFVKDARGAAPDGPMARSSRP